MITGHSLRHSDLRSSCDRAKVRCSKGEAYKAIAAMVAQTIDCSDGRFKGLVRQSQFPSCQSILKSMSVIIYIAVYEQDL